MPIADRSISQNLGYSSDSDTAMTPAKKKIDLITTNKALRIAAKVPGGRHVLVAPSLVFPPEPNKVAFKVSLNGRPRRNAKPFEDDETEYKPNKVWFKVNRQGSVPHMADLVSYKESDLEVWILVYDNPNMLIGVQKFEFQVDLSESKKKQPVNMADYQPLKVSLKTDNTIDDTVLFYFLKRYKTLENPRFGIFFLYNPATNMEVATVHRLRAGLRLKPKNDAK
ncbi:hypothetical protein K440DRAFT_664742 [Wilcoxina mikolae CBS 423.85]|nr:hypothetical protein K440DRAFT_664742 [Wilcoxina mikolae CBS 423.85]